MKNLILKNATTTIIGVAVTTFSGIAWNSVIAFSTDDRANWPAIRHQSIDIAQTVKALDVGTYGTMATGSNNDGMTPDHIPSFAAIKKARETKIGRTLTPSEAENLRNNTNTIVYSTALHQQYSRTYGRRNSEAQILSDSKDLKGAFTKDTQTIRPYLLQSGFTAQQVDSAFQKLDSLNKSAGLY